MIATTKSDLSAGLVAFFRVAFIFAFVSAFIFFALRFIVLGFLLVVRMFLLFLHLDFGLAQWKTALDGDQHDLDLVVVEVGPELTERGLAVNQSSVQSRLQR